jgi:hypothetical protein
MRAETCADPHQRVADVVAVAEVGDPNALERAEAFADGHRVRERLQRVCRVGEPVDHGDARMFGELLDLGLCERPDQDCAHEAREHERRVPAALAAGELQVGRRYVHGHAAELGYSYLGADARARRRLVEDERDGAAREHAQLLTAGPLDLQLVSDVERQLQLLARPGGDARIAPAFERFGDPGHAAMLPGSPSEGGAPSASGQSFVRQYPES